MSENDMKITIERNGKKHSIVITEALYNDVKLVQGFSTEQLLGEIVMAEFMGELDMKLENSKLRNK